MNVQEQLLRDRIDPALTNDNLTRLATEALGERTAVRGYQVLTGGCWNRVIGIDAAGTRLVVKTSPHRADTKIIREFSVLERFRELTALPVPTPLLLDAHERFLPGTTLLMSRIPGRVMHHCYGTLTYEQQERISTQIAEHLAALHTHRVQGFGGVELEPAERHPRWPDFWLPRFDAVIAEAEASGVVPRRLIDGARAIRPHLHATLDIGPESTMTHYDIWSGNVMIDVNSENPSVTGYIDVPGHYADDARELSFALLFGVADRAFLGRYLELHGIDQGFELRANIYNLKMNIRHIQMYPAQRGYQLGAAECLTFVESHVGG